MKIVSVEEMRKVEQLADAGGHSYDAMMERAGRWVASVTEVYRFSGWIQRALVLVGPGNNGGDGLVAAHYLRESGANVTIYIWKRDPKGDPNLNRLKRRRRGVTILWANNDPDFAKLREEIRGTQILIDAILGASVSRPIGEQLAALLAVVKEELAAQEALASADVLAAAMPRAPLVEAYGEPSDLDDDTFDENFVPRLSGPGSGRSSAAGGADLADEEWWEFMEAPLDEPDEENHWPRVPVLAVDCPTGLNCDTGALDPAALPATTTVTFAYPKWGHVQYPGAGACGTLIVVDIGIPAHLAADLPVELTERKDVQAWLPLRPRDANKGSFGKAMVAGGSLLYPGAPALSASAAAHTGAGLVTLAVPRDLQPILAGALLEITWLPLASADGAHTADGAEQLFARLKGYDALLVGPGMTTEESAAGFLDALLARLRDEAGAWHGKLIFDADALNLLSARRTWHLLLPPLSLLTPHPGEMSRLTGLSITEINRNRIATARRFAGEWGHVVLLKGAHTVIAHPDGRAHVLPWAEPALATAGSGDILAGAILAMLSQGVDPFRAAVVGGFVHGLAGALAGIREGVTGVTARELLAYLPRALNQLAMQR